MPWDMEIDDESKKNYMLSKISNKLLGFAAKRLKIEENLNMTPSVKKVQEWKKELKKYSMPKFLSKLLPYYMSGRITTHLFIIEKSSLKQLDKLVKNDKIEPILKDSLSDMYPRIFSTGKKISLLIKKRHKKQLELIERNSKIVLEEYLPLRDIWMIFHLKLGIIEVRTRSDSVAMSMINRISSELRISCEKLSFTNKEMFSFFEWINNNFSNSHIRYQSGPISTQTFTSATDIKGKRIPLTEVKEFLNARNKGQVVSVYAYIPESEFIEELKTKKQIDENQGILEESTDTGDNDLDIKDALEVEGQIGLNVNFTAGKIYFSSAVSEFEVTEIINGIIALLNLKSKRNFDGPDPQNLWDKNSEIY
ncbi:MAG: hypothetical protein ACTSYW_01510 [Candidatus Heimdallarchaeota archaeon]